MSNLGPALAPLEPMRRASLAQANFYLIINLLHPPNKLLYTFWASDIEH